MKRITASIIAMVIAISAIAQGWQMPPMPENVVYFEHNFNLGQVEGRSYNHAPTFFIYPDSRLDEYWPEELYACRSGYVGLLQDVLPRPSDQGADLSWKRTVIYDN